MAGAVYLSADGTSLVDHMGRVISVGGVSGVSDAELQAIADVVSAADKIPYFTGLGTADVTDFTAFARTLIAASSVATAKSVLGIVDASAGTGITIAVDGTISVNNLDIQEFTASGTWTKPAGGMKTFAELIACGGGGGSGRKGSTGTVRGGGGGGAPGCQTRVWLDCVDLGTTEAIVGSATGGAGGTAISANDTDGIAGTAGTDTTFGSLLRASGGQGGAPGTSVDGGIGGVVQGYGSAVPTVGGLKGAGLAVAAVGTLLNIGGTFSGGGGGGGGFDAANTGLTASAGVPVGAYLFTPLAGGVNGASTANGTIGNASANQMLGSGGGGGGRNGGAGGAGAAPGAGGGGGGGATTGNDSGAGGAGGGMFARVTTLLS